MYEGIQTPKEIKIKIHSVSSALMELVWQLHDLLVLFGLRSKKKYWGIVYDSVTKQPLDPALVKLAYVNSKETHTCITDMRGRYGFLAKPGKFKIMVRKDKYAFPSRLVPDSKDEIYGNLYHGEFFELYGDSEVVAPNIPLDPLSADWNQKAKMSKIHYRPYLHRLIRALCGSLFWAGFILTLAYAVHDLPKIPFYLLAVLFLYAIMFLLSFLLPQPRLWGRIYDKRPGIGQPTYFEVQLEKKAFSGIAFGKGMAEADGKFLLLSQQGKFVLHVKEYDYEKRLLAEGSAQVKVPGQGIVIKSLSLYEGEPSVDK